MTDAVPTSVPPARPELRVLVVGQTPPPFGGQAVAIQLMLDGRYERMALSHVPLRFSREMSEIGRVRIRKILQLPFLVLRILWTRYRRHCEVLYYPPAGPDRVPVMRDVVLLLCTRWAFRWTVFHFHAAGLSEIYPRLGRFLKFAFKKAYFEPDVAIELSDAGPADGLFLKAKRREVVPYGVPDEAVAWLGLPRPDNQAPVLLYAGVLRESKGILVLLDACARLRAAGLPFQLRLMGQFESPAFESVVRSQLVDCDLMGSTAICGVLTGRDKWRQFFEADVFCFPTFFESESFGIVLLEAMQFRLPVVTTRWRGIDSIVVDQATGYVVGVRDSEALADRIAVLVRDVELRHSMGVAGRERFLERYTDGQFRNRLESAICSVMALSSHAGEF
jgi:glycosyltransferase involved in cell wall biosynthesis